MARVFMAYSVPFISKCALPDIDDAVIVLGHLRRRRRIVVGEGKAAARRRRDGEILLAGVGRQGCFVGLVIVGYDGNGVGVVIVLAGQHIADEFAFAGLQSLRLLDEIGRDLY